MHKPAEQPEKKLQSEHAADEIRADEFIKVTQGEAARNEQRLQDIPMTDRKYWRAKEKEGNALPKGIKWGIAGLIILFIGGSIISFYIARKNVAASISTRLATLQAGVNDLQNFDPTSAEKQFSSLNATSTNGIMGTIVSLFENGSGAVHSFSDLSKQLATLSQDITSAENDAFSFISAGGSTFANDLKNINTALTAIDADASQLSGVASSFGSGSSINGESYIALKTEVEGAEHFLNAFVPWLSDASTTHHLLVLLQNPSEMRPGGGFLGSYADISINGGNITDISVHDIADVDTAFMQKIIPPVPLQLEETAWRPADANWFFDFPTTASETIDLFQRSGLYASASTTFDGAIAVTPQVMSDLLSATGPITVPGQTSRAASTTFTANNLVVQIQKIVQAGQAGSSAGNATYPKKILGELTKAIFQNLASSTDAQKQQIMGMALNWIANKDVVTYFKDPSLETFITANGAGGDEYQLPQNFNGDYLAIANADINSDKSELYVSQKVSFDTEINSDGTATEHLIIDRAHNGNESPYWWYQTTNQDYMQIFLPQGTSLDNQSGGIVKNVPAPINYSTKGYLADPLLLAIQSSTQASFAYPKITLHDEGGKEVVGVWSRVFAGNSTELSFDYSHHLYSAPAAGVQYQFVFEKQPGAQGDYKFNINAPLGYVFAENDLASFNYESTSTPGRLIINLTLQKL